MLLVRELLSVSSSIGPEFQNAAEMNPPNVAVATSRRFQSLARQIKADKHLVGECQQPWLLFLECDTHKIDHHFLPFVLHRIYRWSS